MSQTPRELHPRPQDIDMIRNVVVNNKVFIDTSSLLALMYPQLKKILFPIFKELGEKLFVPKRVIDELKRFETDSNHKCYEQAHYALKSLARYQKDKLIELRGEESDNPLSDNVFLTVFTKFRMQYQLALITQDVALARDILQLNELKSQNGKDISAYRITSYGTLGKNDGNLAKQQAVRSNDTEDRQRDKQQGQNTLFHF